MKRRSFIRNNVITASVILVSGLLSIEGTAANLSCSSNVAVNAQCKKKTFLGGGSMRTCACSDNKCDMRCNDDDGKCYFTETCGPALDAQCKCAGTDAHGNECNSTKFCVNI